MNCNPISRPSSDSCWSTRYLPSLWHKHWQKNSLEACPAILAVSPKVAKQLFAIQLVRLQQRMGLHAAFHALLKLHAMLPNALPYIPNLPDSAQNSFSFGITRGPVFQGLRRVLQGVFDRVYELASATTLAP